MTKIIQKRKLIRKIIMIIIIILMLFFINIPISYSIDEDTTETIESQQEEFGISDFIKGAQEYSGEFFEGIDVNDILQNAIKGEVDN